MSQHDGGPDGAPGNSVLSALGDLGGRALGSAGGRIAAAGALSLMVLTGLIIVHAQGGGSSAGASTPSPNPSGSSTQNAGTTSGGATTSGVVTLEITVRNKPPCSFPLGITDMEPADGFADRAEANRVLISTSAACTFELRLKQGTKLTWVMKNPSTGGWQTEHTWSGPCAGSFTANYPKIFPDQSVLTCTATLNQSTTLAMVFETVGWEYTGGQDHTYTADYPGCLPARFGPCNP